MGARYGRTAYVVLATLAHEGGVVEARSLTVPATRVIVDRSPDATAYGYEPGSQQAANAAGTVGTTVKTFLAPKGDVKVTMGPPARGLPTYQKVEITRRGLETLLRLAKDRKEKHVVSAAMRLLDPSSVEPEEEQVAAPEPEPPAEAAAAEAAAEGDGVDYRALADELLLAAAAALTRTEPQVDVGNYEATIRELKAANERLRAEVEERDSTISRLEHNNEVLMQSVKSLEQNTRFVRGGGAVAERLSPESRYALQKIMRQRPGE